MERDSQPKTSLAQVLRLMAYLDITIEATMNDEKSKPVSVDLSKIVNAFMWGLLPDNNRLLERLAPFYDIASLLPYTTQHKELRLAMSLAGKYRDDQISIESLSKAAKAVGYPAEVFIGYVRSMSNRLCDVTSDVIHAMKSRGIGNPVLGRIIDCWSKRVEQISEKIGKREL